MPSSSRSRILILLPILGIIIYSGLYYLATIYYPGGSAFDEKAMGFSWTKNYWCNLLYDRALNGQPNTAKPLALTAMAVLSLSLGLFWWLFPAYTALSHRLKLLIRIAGILAMLTGSLLFTRWEHDLIINIASFFGLIALGGTFAGLYKNGWKKLFYAGLIILPLIGLNNFCYYNPDFIHLLPIIQKITFAYFLIWIIWIQVKIFRGLAK